MSHNVNIPNRGQTLNLPLGAVVETNAVFRDNSLEPVFAGPIPTQIHSLINNIVGEQEMLKAVRERDLEQAFQAFTVDNLVTISHTDARKLFDEMINNTKHYLVIILNKGSLNKPTSFYEVGFLMNNKIDCYINWNLKM